MRYVYAMIAGLWMADGVALLVAPREVISHVRHALRLSPRLVSWEGVTAMLGLALLMGTEGLPYKLVWMMTGMLMVIKGLFLTAGPEPWRHQVIDWCLTRAEIDYRFMGLSLCTLALLLLRAAGWIGGE